VVLTMHHPTEATLMAYSAGGLPEVFSIVVATHIAQCEACQRDVALLDSMGGALMEQIEPATVEEDALARVLQRLDEAPSPPPAMVHPALPAPLNHIGMGRWWPLVRGVRWRRLQTAGGGFVVLIKGEAGRALPRHTHPGMEMTAVLSGAFTDANGIYAAGDFSETIGEHIEKPPTVTKDGPCVCVLASEGMNLTGVFGQLQRLIGL
jgi:putative transcriptional regulator